MSDLESKITEAIEKVVEKSERITAMLKPEWEARRDTAKTLISLSGATLVFTITFSQSVVKPDTPMYWRYAVVACWLTFIFSLICCLGSLWFSMTLASLPILITGKAKELKSALEESRRIGSNKPFIETTMSAFGTIALREKIALWLLRFGIIFYGIALSIFTTIGLRQLLR
jgi:hypothetical protein